MKAILIGRGKMGEQIKEVLEERDHEVLALTDALDTDFDPSLFERCDVVIDFSHPDNLNWYLPILQPLGKPLVLGTTALSEEQLAALDAAAKEMPVFQASNFSLGISILSRLAAQTAAILQGRWDMEITETHHNQKKDAPSGTALTLLEAIDPNDEYEHLFGRSGLCGARKKEIGIHALRGGTVPGDHDIHFFGPDEQLTLSHKAQSRRIFANGAADAAQFLILQQPGRYNMDALVSEALND